MTTYDFKIGDRLEYAGERFDFDKSISYKVEDIFLISISPYVKLDGKRGWYPASQFIPERKNRKIIQILDNL